MSISSIIFPMIFEDEVISHNTQNLDFDIIKQEYISNMFCDHCDFCDCDGGAAW